MRPTRFGLQALSFYIVTLAAFFAAPYSNLFFLLLGFLTILLVGGVLSARRNLRGVMAVFDDLRPVPSEARAALSVRLSAPARARFQLEMRLELAAGESFEGHVDVLEGEAQLSLHAPSLPRGCHALARARVASSHPFGLVRVTREVAAPGELVVYPSPRGLLEGRSAIQALDQLLGRSDPGAGDLQPSGLRDHRAEDGVRGIHWRASARRASLVVREWEGGSGEGLEVLLDRRCAAEELEEALAAISAVVHHARTGKEALRIHSQGLSETYGPGQRPWSEALRFLASAQPVSPDGPAPPATSPTVARFPRDLARHQR